MDSGAREIFTSNFFENPVFFLESARICAGLSKYVLLQQTFSDIILKSLPELDQLLRRYLGGSLGVDELYLKICFIEDLIKQDVDNTTVSKFCKKLDLNIHPKVFFVNRILNSPPFVVDVNIYISKNDDELEKLQNIERKVLKGKLSYSTGKSKIIRLEGRMLGYPNCCIENYVEGKETGKSAERDLIYECLTKGYFDFLLMHCIQSRILFTPSLFTSNFYPCSIECSKAIRIGERIREWLEDISPSLPAPFEFRTMINGLYLLTTAYKTCIHEKSKQLQIFFSKLDEDSINLISSVATVISNLTDFTNTLIGRIFRN